MPGRFTPALSELGEAALLPRLPAAARERAPRVSSTARPLDVDEPNTSCTAAVWTRSWPPRRQPHTGPYASRCSTSAASAWSPPTTPVIVPEYVGEVCTASRRVRLVRLPFGTEPVEVALHARHESSRSPSRRWLVQFMAEMLGERVSAAQLPPYADRVHWAGCCSVLASAAAASGAEDARMVPGPAGHRVDLTTHLLRESV